MRNLSLAAYAALAPIVTVLSQRSRLNGVHLEWKLTFLSVRSRKVRLGRLRVGRDRPQSGIPP